jgi:Flp pilus assembly protein TadG
MTTRHPIPSLVRALREDQRGAAAVELTLLLPVLLALFVLIAEGGRVLWHHQLISEGVRDATRYLSRVADPASATEQARAVNLAMRGSLAGGSLRLGAWSDPATVTPTLATIANNNRSLRGPTTIRVVTVTARVPLDYPFARALRFFVATAPVRLTITAADSARHYGG